MAGATNVPADTNRLFEAVKFTIVLNDDEAGFETEKIKSRLEAGGATHLSLSSSSLAEVTHIIADSADFPAYDDAVSAFIEVVRPLWVEHSLNKGRLAVTRQYRPDPRLFLSGVVIAISEEIPEGDKDAIIGGVQAMGGQYTPIMTMSVTHVVALTMENKKCQIIVEKALKCKPVLPHWFDACLMLGKMIDPSPYVLPDPSILRPENMEDELKDKSKYSDTLAELRRTMQLGTSPPSVNSPSKSRKELSVFRGHRVKLAADLQLEPRLRDTLVTLITKSMGEVVEDIDQAGTLVCRYRSGLDFMEALDTGKDIGNLTWLFTLINRNKWSSPLSKMLHFPLPKKSLPGFDKYVMSLSNYTGEARTYLENLVTACGGRFTKTMTQNNTHLITAHTQSEKVTAAREWDIATVNHLWLEESYAACKGLALTNPRFTTFPLRTNLGEIIGKTQLDREALVATYLHHRKTTVEQTSTMTRTPAKLASGGATMPGPLSYQDKENDTPGSRIAKDRAINKLHMMAPDIAQFEKELKRRGGVIYGGRRVGDADRVAMNTKNAAPASSKRTSSDRNEDDEMPAGVTNSAQKRKKLATHTLSAEPIRFVVTGGPTFKWTEAKGRALAKLGLRELPKMPPSGAADVLVAPRVMRTPNFLAGVAAGLQIVGPSWLEEMSKEGRQIDPHGYELKDVISEEDFRVDLSVSLRRAREHRARGGMLHGLTIHCTESIKGGVETMMDIVKRNGGTCNVYKGMDVGWNKRHEDRAFLISVPKDHALWNRYSLAAKNHGLDAKIVNSDWLLRIALTQNKDDWESGFEFPPKDA